MPVVFYRFVVDVSFMIPELFVMIMVPVMFERFAEPLDGTTPGKLVMFMLPVTRMLIQVPMQTGIYVMHPGPVETAMPNSVLPDTAMCPLGRYG